MRNVAVFCFAIFVTWICIYPVSDAHSEQRIEFRKGFDSNNDGHGYFRFLAQEHNRYPSQLVISGSEEMVYSLGRRAVGAYRIVDQELEPVGGWPLTRWEGEYMEEEIPARYRKYHLERSGPAMVSRGLLGDWLGCMPQSPLRYGDFTGNGYNELVLFIQGDFLVFSPQSQQTLFSTSMRVNDWMTREETTGYLRGGELSEQPQFQSRIAAAAVGNYQGMHEPGYRGYSKLFVIDPDDDGQQDLLMWRKFYTSRFRDDPVDGFKKLHDRLFHYEFVDGQYRRHDTDEAVIRSWLTDRDLTWPKGYPNYSECDGEQGQLIPEMHDPLLNDPEVLEGVDPETMTIIENEED